MTETLSTGKGLRRRISHARSTTDFGTIMPMPIEDSLPEQVARRLRAVMADAGHISVQQLADLCGAERSAASNWINGYNLPPVDRMVRLVDELKLNLDWIYRGVPDALPMKTGIRLTAILEGVDWRASEPGRAARPAATPAAAPLVSPDQFHKKSSANG